LTDIELEPCPVNPEWVISGNPEARWKLITKSRDKMATKVVWECTPGVFEWRYDDDETIYVMAGEAFLVRDGAERRFGTGDMVFFPAGSRCIWRVTKTVRKFAILRRDLPFPVSLAIRAAGRMARMVKGGVEPWS
jgi:uncharacterized cupin superfamily protein